MCRRSPIGLRERDQVRRHAPALGSPLKRFGCCNSPPAPEFSTVGAAQPPSAGLHLRSIQSEVALCKYRPKHGTATNPCRR
jgi:hypothetical protein